MEKQKHRVQKIISNSGYCSRRKAEELIKEGLVTVNGEVVEIGASATMQDKIVVDGDGLKFGRKIYIMLNKPKGYECTLHPSKKNVLRIINLKERIYPVGRLDVNTTGLLLLTNDGDFANSVIHPSKKIEKSYVIELDKAIEKTDLEKLNKGVRLRDGKVFAKVKKIDKKILRIALEEGRKHIVKRTMFKLGYFVKKLSRVQIGGLVLNVKEGNWRELTKKDREKIFL